MSEQRSIRGLGSGRRLISVFAEPGTLLESKIPLFNANFSQDYKAPTWQQLSRGARSRFLYSISDSRFSITNAGSILGLRVTFMRVFPLL